MKLNWFLDWILDSLLAFSLIFNAVSMFDLFSERHPFYLGLGLLLIPVELMTGHFYIDRLAQNWKKRKLLKSVLVQEAIMVISQQPGFTEEEAKRLVLSMCRNLTKEVYELLLSSLSGSREDRMVQISSLESKICIGDITCKNNARSPYIRCAIAPELKTCVGCKDYSKIKEL